MTVVLTVVFEFALDKLVLTSMTSEVLIFFSGEGSFLDTDFVLLPFFYTYGTFNFGSSLIEADLVLLPILNLERKY